MNVLKVLTKLIIGIFLWAILVNIGMILMSKLNVIHNPKKEYILIASKENNDINLIPIKDSKDKNIWFEKNESIAYPQYGGMEVKVLKIDSTKNFEELEVIEKTDNYEKTFTYSINNREITPISYYNDRGAILIVFFFSTLIMHMVGKNYNLFTNKKHDDKIL